MPNPELDTYNTAADIGDETSGIPGLQDAILSVQFVMEDDIYYGKRLFSQNKEIKRPS